jgi:hypothetical protein
MIFRVTITVELDDDKVNTPEKFAAIKQAIRFDIDSLNTSPSIGLFITESVIKDVEEE